MSIDCMGCFSTVYQPDTPWYACTGFSPFRNHLCGTCVATLPVEVRKPVTVLQDFEITFGPVITGTGSRRNYNCLESTQGRAVFAVSPQAILDSIPFAESFLEELYPYWCMDTYCQNLVRFEDVEKKLSNLWMHREPVQKWLSLTVPSVDSNRYNKYGINPGPRLEGMRMVEKQLTEQEKKEMYELFVKICAWVAKK